MTTLFALLGLCLLALSFVMPGEQYILDFAGFLLLAYPLADAAAKGMKRDE